MKIAMLVGPALLGAAALAHAQSGDAAREALQQAATGEVFRIGYTEFRIAPAGAVTPAGARKPAGSPQLQVAGYAIELSGGNAKAAGAGDRLAAAVGDDGKPVVVTSTLNVYHRNVAVLRDAARASGGRLTYASEAGGNGRIEFDSVADALAAMHRIRAIAGVREVSPEIIQGRDEAN